MTWDGEKKPNCSKPTEKECFEIPVSSDDPVFVNSIPMNRAARCKLIKAGERKPEEQVNTATSFIDASHIYGNYVEEEMKLRDLTSVAGLLRTTCLLNMSRTCYRNCNLMIRQLTAAHSATRFVAFTLATMEETMLAQVNRFVLVYFYGIFYIF